MLREFVTVSNPYEYLSELEWNDKLAVAVSLANVENDENILKLDLFCFNNQNHIYEYPLKMFASKQFPFMVELNRIIKMATESGLIVKWLKGIQYGPICEIKPLFEYIDVTFEMFAVFLVIISSMYLFTIFILIIERITFKEIQLQNVRPLWRFTDMMINAKRYYLVEFFCQHPFKLIRFKRLQN